MNAREEGVVPDWLLERLAAGELPPERAAAVRERLAREPGGAERLARLSASDTETLAAHPPAAVAESVRRRAALAGRRRAAAAAEPRRRLLFVGAPTVLVAAAVAVLWLRPGTPSVPLPPDDGDGIVIKGDPSLLVYRKAGKRPERLANGAAVHAGDQLQLAYVARGKRYGAVLSLDGAGKVTFHLPSDGAAKAAPLGTRGEVFLPESYELDDAPRFERFLLVAGDAPFDVAPLAAVITGAAAPPPGTKTVELTVRKED